MPSIGAANRVVITTLYRLQGALVSLVKTDMDAVGFDISDILVSKERNEGGTPAWPLKTGGVSYGIITFQRV